MRTILAMAGALILSSQAYTQSLFSYGDHQVNSDEFIRAFRKNAEPGKVNETTVRNYLELYTRFKLKVQDAYTMRLDTLVNKQEDIAGFRKQIEDQYLYDSALYAKLIQEARERGRKEIRLSHILIPFKEEFASYPMIDVIITAADREKARLKAEKAYARLTSGEDFSKVALEMSSDTTVKLNKGDLGYITVFTLPYALENVAYNLPLQGISAPFASDKGYHIIRKTGERPASGTMDVQQILIAYDTEGGASAKQQAKKQIDSLYRALQQGASFDELARTFSYDMASASGGGILPPVSIGVYDPAFQEKVFALTRDGELSQPFETALGFHLVKRLRHIPLDSNSIGGLPWKTALEQDKRGQLPLRAFEKSTLEVTGMKVLATDMPELFRYTYSTLHGEKIFSAILNDQTALLQFPKRKLAVADWLGYAQGRVRHNTNDEYAALWEDFKTAMSADYYRANLESFNPAFKAQITEFTEGNMLFEVMDRQVWSKATADTSGLRHYYEANKSRYNWGKSADVIVVTASDSVTAAAARKEIMAAPGAWRGIMERSGGRITADSSRIEWKLLMPENAAMKANTATPVVVNREDQSAIFSYIVRIYAKPAPKSFTDARVQVINDYQQVLEESWILALKKKYPVTVNTAELDQVVKTLTR